MGDAAATPGAASSATAPMTLTLNRLANAAVVSAIASARAPEDVSLKHAKTIDEAMETHRIAVETMDALDGALARLRARS